MIGFGWLGVPVVLAVLLFAWLCFTKVRDEGALLGRALFVFAAQVVGVLLVLSLLWLALVRKPRADEAQAQHVRFEWAFWAQAGAAQAAAQVLADPANQIDNPGQLAGLTPHQRQLSESGSSHHATAPAGG